jgi:hypothetical protein
VLQLEDHQAEVVAPEEQEELVEMAEDPAVVVLHSTPHLPVMDHLSKTITIYNNARPIAYQQRIRVSPILLLIVILNLFVFICLVYFKSRKNR